MTEQIRRATPVAAVIAVAVLGVGVLWQGVSFAMAVVELQSIERVASELEATRAEGDKPKAFSEKDRAKAEAERKEAADRFTAMVKRGMFGKAPVHPRLTGIIGDMAIIDGQMVSVGDRVGKAKVAEIDAMRVVLSIDENKTSMVLTLFGGLGHPSSPGGEHRSDRPSGSSKSKSKYSKSGQYSRSRERSSSSARKYR